MEQSLTPRVLAPSIAARRWRVAACVALLSVVMFGALVQAGILAPALGSHSGGVEGGVGYVSIDNQSPRAWTVIARFPNGTDVERFEGGTLRVILDRTEREGVPANPAGQLTVQPGQQFVVYVTLHHVRCPSDKTQVPNPPVVLRVATPIGTKTIPESITVSC